MFNILVLAFYMISGYCKVVVYWLHVIVVMVLSISFKLHNAKLQSKAWIGAINFYIDDFTERLRKGDKWLYLLWENTSTKL